MPCPLPPTAKFLCPELLWGTMTRVDPFTTGVVEEEATEVIVETVALVTNAERYVCCVHHIINTFT